MTGEERANEMRRWEVLTVPFGDLHARIEALVGRPVWTHEMGPGWESLIEESRTRPGIVDMQRIIDSLAETMPTTVVVVDE